MLIYFPLLINFTKACMSQWKNTILKVRFKIFDTSVKTIHSTFQVLHYLLRFRSSQKNPKILFIIHLFEKYCNIKLNHIKYCTIEMNNLNIFHELNTRSLWKNYTFSNLNLVVFSTNRTSFNVRWKINCWISEEIFFHSDYQY